MSARACSRANSVFFEPEPLASQERPYRIVGDVHPPSRQLSLQAMQRQMRGLLQPFDNERPVRLQDWSAVAAHFARCDRSRSTLPLGPLHNRGNRNPKPNRNRSAAFPSRHGCHNAFSKIIGKWSRHQMLASRPASILNQTRPQLGIPNRFRLTRKRSNTNLRS